MTHFRFERFGSFLLEVCQDFNAKRMNYLEDKQLAEMMAKAEEAKVFNTPSSNNPIYKNDTQRYVTKFGFYEKAIKFEKKFFVVLLTRASCSVLAAAYLSKSRRRFFKTNVVKSYYTNFTYVGTLK